MKPLDLTGQKFGMLTAVRSTGEKLRSSYLWEFRCDCGNLVVRSGPAVKFGMIKSCGCATSAMISEARTTHGLTKGRRKRADKALPKEYRVWLGIKTRCTNKNDASYLEYGARGVYVCAEWMDSYEAFFNHIGPCPSDTHSIDRIDTKEGYVINNVRWATPKEQSNNRTTNRLVEIEGVVKTLAQWVEYFGLVDYACARHRIAVRGWDPKQALTIPAGVKRG